MGRLVLVLLLAPLLLGAQSEVKEIRDAGVCSRCHVSSSLEWGISKHAASSVACTGCHGESAGHVLNEQNGVKPDLLTHGTAIAGLCATCHQAGCPKSMKTSGCQTCHQVHALVNPTAAASSSERVRDLEAKAAEWRRHVQSGGEAMRAAKWRAASDAYRSALRLNPSDGSTRSNLELAERSLHPPPALLDLDLVWIPAADFDLGSDKRPATSPVHTLHVAPFYLSRTQITPEQWKALMGSSVNGVSWDDTQNFIAALNRKVAGGGFRLPTEAEWEYVARAAATFGIRDMPGRLSEWCSSLYRPYPYRPDDGRESLATAGLRVIRGSNYAEPKEWFDVAERHAGRPGQRLPFNGFRVAFAPPKD